MAKCQAIKAVVEYELKLTKQEAEVIYALCQRVAGSSIVSSRGIADTVGSALREAGVVNPWSSCNPQVEGTITFTDKLK